ncbi:hypothetical protein [Winogradskyella sp.]|uniref:hypothetical protein n=1 Tax=Winogradskyella sp. TaxID=1883156 RepID=UPI003BACDBA5
MGEKYKFDKKANWKYLYKSLLITFLAHILTAFLILIYNSKTESASVLSIVFIAVISAWILFFATPLIILYFNHRQKSKSVNFKVNNDKSYIYKTKSELIKFNNDNIEKIELNLSPPKYDKRIDFLYFGMYHFTRIYTHEDRVIDLSCLVFDKTEEVFPKELIRKRKKIFPLL